MYLGQPRCCYSRGTRTRQFSALSTAYRPLEREGRGPLRNLGKRSPVQSSPAQPSPSMYSRTGPAACSDLTAAVGPRNGLALCPPVPSASSLAPNSVPYGRGRHVGELQAGTSLLYPTYHSLPCVT